MILLFESPVDIYWTVFLSVVSSLIASAMFQSIISQFFKPVIVISDFIYHSVNGSFYFKFVNRTWMFDILNINCEAYSIANLGPKSNRNMLMSKINLLDDTRFRVPKERSNDYFNTHAIWISTSDNLSEMIFPNGKIVLEISAKHPWGIFKTYTKEFAFDNIVNRPFKMGNDLGIVEK